MQVLSGYSLFVLRIEAYSARLQAMQLNVSSRYPQQHIKQQKISDG